jgi:hypothetical protein
MYIERHTIADTVIIYFTKIMIAHAIDIFPKFEISFYSDNSFQNTTMSRRKSVIISKYDKISNFRMTFTTPIKTIAIMEKTIQIYLHNRYENRREK